MCSSWVYWKLNTKLLRTSRWSNLVSHYWTCEFWAIHLIWISCFEPHCKLNLWIVGKHGMYHLFNNLYSFWICFYEFSKYQIYPIMIAIHLFVHFLDWHIHNECNGMRKGLGCLCNNSKLGLYSTTTSLHYLQSQCCQPFWIVSGWIWIINGLK